MIKFVRQRTASTTSASASAIASSSKSARPLLRKKGESNDSGTESDGDPLDADKQQSQRHLDIDMETSLSSCADANSPTDTACSSESSAAMLCQAQQSLLYDQHSSEEELEVINGPSSAAAGEAGQLAGGISGRGPGGPSQATGRRSNSVRGSTGSDTACVKGSGGTACGAGSAGRASSFEPEVELCSLEVTASTSKRSSSTLVENRKRSLAHSSDDELQNFQEPILTTPVNFRTSPPLEAFKPNRSHRYRSTTPLILAEARCGIENIKLCDNSVNDENGGGEAASGHRMHVEEEVGECPVAGNAPSTSTASVIKVCGSSLKMSRSSHHIYQPQPKYNFHYNSSRSSPASTTGLDSDAVRSVSPPAKLFHCAISPKRRPMRSSQQHQQQQQHNNGSVGAARMQHRPHRPCLDFDKMQQVSL